MPDDAPHDRIRPGDHGAAEDGVGPAGVGRPGETQGVCIHLRAGDSQYRVHTAAADVQREVPPGPDVAGRDAARVQFRVGPRDLRKAQAHAFGGFHGCAICVSHGADTGRDDVAEDDLVKPHAVGVRGNEFDGRGGENFALRAALVEHGR